ncbi:MAG: hypothetical protein IJ949_07785, partial [Oscillospiraceae bacterium]|nr:hypothetical protein [Oscillospiraceae bacterium]
VKTNDIAIATSTGHITLSSVSCAGDITLSVSTGKTKLTDCVTTLYLTGGEIRIHMNGILEACRSDGVFEKISYDNSLSEMDAQIQTVIETMTAGGKPGIDGDYGKDIIRAIKTVYATEEK